jgi:hypothetical protein
MSLPSTIKYNPDELTVANFKKAKHYTPQSPPCLCGDLTFIRKHFATMTRSTKTGLCKVCNKSTLWKCGLCKRRMCVNDGKSVKGAGCAVRFNDDTFFGLTRSDSTAMFESDPNA